MSLIQRPKSDLGTILLHWLIVASLLGTLLTGLSIASGDPALPALRHLDFLFPGENVWYLHVTFGTALLSSVLAYVGYIIRAGLADRIRFNWGRFAALFQGGRSRWASANVLLYWALFAGLASEVLTGILLFLGCGGLLLVLHLQLTWFFLLFPVAHAFGHWLYGRWPQMLRILRPTWRLPQRTPQLVDALIARIRQLEADEPSLPHALKESSERGRNSQLPKTVTIAVPLAIAAAVGALVLPFAVTVDRLSRETLRVVRITAAEAPAIDGDLADPAWRRAPVTTVLTQHGANFDNGESKVEIRALNDGEFAYFAFTWTDPTRSLTHMPLVKREDGWHLMRSAPEGNETQFHEDKFAVLLAPGGQHLIGKGIHLGQQPLSDKPASATGRGLHFVESGLVDVWQWRASHGGMAGWVDDDHFGPPLEASGAASSMRYSGGFAQDPGASPYQDNFEVISNLETYPLVRPRRLPKDLNRALKLPALGLNPEISSPESADFWMLEDDSEPYSKERDRVLPVGSIIPSVILSLNFGRHSDFGDVTGTAHWAAGRWTLELRRRLDTGSPFDVPIKTGALMWVAPFDHAETWHSYHVRPLVLEVE